MKICLDTVENWGGTKEKNGGDNRIGLELIIHTLIGVVSSPDYSSSNYVGYLALQHACKH